MSANGEPYEFAAFDTPGRRCRSMTWGSTVQAWPTDDPDLLMLQEPEMGHIVGWLRRDGRYAVRVPVEDNTMLYSTRRMVSRRFNMSVYKHRGSGTVLPPYGYHGRRSGSKRGEDHSVADFITSGYVYGVTDRSYDADGLVSADDFIVTADVAKKKEFDKFVKNVRALEARHGNLQKFAPTYKSYEDAAKDKALSTRQNARSFAQTFRDVMADPTNTEALGKLAIYPNAYLIGGDYRCTHPNSIDSVFRSQRSFMSQLFGVFGDLSFLSDLPAYMKR